MKRVSFVLLLLLIVSAPISAFSPRDSFIGSTVSIAWLEGRTLNVALANDTNTRNTVTISTTATDAWGRPVFAERRVNVPARSIIVETFTPSTPRRGEDLNVQLSEGYRTIGVPVQKWDNMTIEDYIVPSNTSIEIKVDLDFMLIGGQANRLIIDDYYQTDDGRVRGPIRVDTLEGGLRYVRQTNSVEYAKPYMVLSMTTPQTTGLTMLNFSLVMRDDYRRRDEEIGSPIILVYGRNVRPAPYSSSGSSDSGRVGR